MKIRLTKKIVEAAVPRAQRYLLWDADVAGFGLKVQPSGQRSYFAYYRSASGQQRRPTIGPHGVLTLDQARQIARQWLSHAALGGDVSADRQSGRKAATVKELAERYLADYAQVHKKPRSIATDRANIENHVIPLIGSKRITELRRSDIERILFSVKEGKTSRTLPARLRGRRVIRGGAGIANRVVALVSKMLSCAVQWELAETNVARGVRKFRESKRERFLSQEEIARLLSALDRIEASDSGNSFAVGAIRVLLLTGMRTSEVVGLKWRDVDFETACLRLSDSKTGSRIIPLSSLALDVIIKMPPGLAGEYVFQSATKGRPISLTRRWYFVRSEADIDRTATLHTLRHTFASWAVMDGQSLAQVGAMLGHKSAQTTMRYANHQIEALRAYSQRTAAILARNIDRPASKRNDEIS